MTIHSRRNPELPATLSALLLFVHIFIRSKHTHTLVPNAVSLNNILGLQLETLRHTSGVNDGAVCDTSTLTRHDQGL